MPDWDDLRSFLAVAWNASLSATAKGLHVAQSTVGVASCPWKRAVRLLAVQKDIGPCGNA